MPAFSFASALTSLRDSRAAFDDVCAPVLEKLGGPPDVAILFLSRDRKAAAETIASGVAEQLRTTHVIGCTGETIVGVGRELEDEPALSLWAAKLPGCTIRPLTLAFERTPDGGLITGWPDDLPPLSPRAFLILLADPFFFPTDVFLERLREDHPQLPVVGGMASGGHQPGENRLLCGGKTFAEGAVALLIDGPVRLRTVVSQGCRPIGKPLVITKAERNVIFELGGRPALLQLKEIFDTLPTSEQRLVQSALHVGRVVSEYRDHFDRGDFLVRNVVGIDPKAGAVAVGDYVRVGQTIQFHIRDADTADGELKQMLAKTRLDGITSSAGALLFSCNGRGTRLFSGPHHDAGCIATSWGKLPLAGFFAQGEIGPVGGENFVHGFTASVALLEAVER